MDRRAVVFWSGGKDCCLAHLLFAKKYFPPSEWITFSGYDRFLCHPQDLLIAQSRSAQIKLRFFVFQYWNIGIYQLAIEELAAEGVTDVITGDIPSSRAEFESYWLFNLCKDAGVNLHCPLVDYSEHQILGLMFDLGVSPVFTGVKPQHLALSHLSQPLFTRADEVGFVKELSQKSQSICGEQGQYHTQVVNSSLFTLPISLVFGERAISSSGIAFRDITIPGGIPWGQAIPSQVTTKVKAKQIFKVLDYWCTPTGAALAEEPSR